MSPWIKRALFVAIALVLLNDGGRYILATYRIQERSRTMAFEAAKVAKGDLRANSGWPAAQKVAKDAGIEVIAYEQSQTSATVVTRLQIPGTWIMGPVYALMTRKPITTPLAIEHRTTQSG
jgi:hypothetical protein